MDRFKLTSILTILFILAVGGLNVQNLAAGQTRHVDWQRFNYLETRQRL
jgi:hypothetical protein